MEESELHTDLSKKLGLSPGDQVLVYNVPSHYGNLLGPITDHIYWLESISRGIADFIHIFSTNKQDLRGITQQYFPALKQSGMLWVSWPKKSSPLHKALDKEAVRNILLSNTPLEDVKGAAIDKDWRGLKFVFRKANRS